MDETTRYYRITKTISKYRFLAHTIPSKENWINFRNARNKLKKKMKDAKTTSYKKILTSKNSKYGKLFTVS